MTTDLIEKLKDNVDIDLVANFDYLDFVKYSFIPLCIKNNYYYIATDDKKFNSEGEQFVRNILGLESKYKFIALSSNILNNLITWYKNSAYKVSKKARAYLSKLKKESPHEKKMLGELLTEAGLITESQLAECLIISKQLKIPLGSVLIQKNYITVEDLREFLTFQTGKIFINTEDLKISKEILNLLPEDFVRLHKVIPISVEDKNLVLGMLNPNDKRALNEVVYLTGLKITVRLMTNQEFENLLDTYYNKSNK